MDPVSYPELIFVRYLDGKIDQINAFLWLWHHSLKFSKFTVHSN